MGINLNVETNNEEEFNQQIQMYLAQGYSMQSNFNGTAILKKKSYSLGVFIILLIFLFPIGIIYYLVASDDIVNIRNKNPQASGNNTNANTNTAATTGSFDFYCEDCGQGLYNHLKFCPNCGKDLSEIGEAVEILTCENCGTELNEEHKFCPECGKDLNEIGEEIIEVSSVDIVNDDEAVEILTCENCGTEVSEEDKFCTKCGKEQM